MACSMAGRSSEKSACSGTGTKLAPASFALISYITKDGAGAITTAPGCATSWHSRLISSSEPLPSTSRLTSG